MLQSVLTPWRLKWYPRGVLIAVAIIFVLIMTSDLAPTAETGFVGGDYRAFYAAGEIIANGEIDQLYTTTRQSHYQRQLFDDRTIVVPFAYPPHFALIYAPLSQLPFRTSYAIHSLVMAAALALACFLIQRIYPALIKTPDLLFFLALTSYPILRSVFGGQNTALSILLIVLCWYKVLHNRHYQAGIFLGLLFFKPQFAVPLAGLFLLSGRWRVWVSAGATAAVLFAFNTALMGPGWFADWFEFVRTFSRFDVQVNFGQLVSWLGFSQSLFGEDSRLAVALGWGLSAVTILGISWIWFAGGRKADFGAQLGLASVCILLIPPHTLFYDAGIALIAVVVLLPRLGRLSPVLIVGVWALLLLQIISPDLGVSLSFLPLVLILGLAAACLWRDGASPRTQPSP
jgi:hypothetical protein